MDSHHWTRPIFFLRVFMLIYYWDITPIYVPKQALLTHYFYI